MSPIDRNLYDLVVSRRTDPAAVYLETPEGRIIRHGELDRLSGQIGAALKRLGVEPGDRVAAQVPKSPEALLLYLAAARIGAAFLPLNSAYTPAELAYFLGDAEPAVFVCDPARRAALEPVAAAAGVRHLLTLDAEGQGTLTDAAAAEDGAIETLPRRGDDLAAILYTSGTTGRSKGAMLTHANLSSNALALVDYWRFTADDVLLHALPVFHTHGLFVASNVMLLAGGAMLYLPGLDAGRLIALMPRATAMMGVPTFYTRLLADPRLTRELVAHMRLFVSGSAPLSAETHKEWSERTGHAILERYGMTETNMNTSNPYEGERRPGSVGLPLPGVELRITRSGADAHAPPELLPLGEVGVIEVRGPNVFAGYWRNPAKTAEEKRADGFFITGDLGRIEPDGYVSIVGRAKDLVISGGYNVYPAEVEAVIDALPGVAESAVIGAPHPDFGEGVIACVAPRPGAELSEDAVKAALDGQLARFKQPKRVFVLESLPRNTMGKIEKARLREAYAGIFSA